MQKSGFQNISEQSSKIGKRLEQGQAANQFLPKQQKIPQKTQEDLRLETEELEKKDKEHSEAEIKKISQFLQEVAHEEKNRQQEMRRRVEEIVDEGLKKDREDKKEGMAEGMGKLVEPSSKPKKGSWLAGLKKKGKGAMTEAKGAVAKGGG